MEQILSGYCRTIDASRMVLVEEARRTAILKSAPIGTSARSGSRSRSCKNGGTDMNICLYGASSPALDRAYFDAAEEFGRLLAKTATRSSTEAARRALWALQHAALRTRAENHRHRAELFKCRRHSV